MPSLGLNNKQSMIFWITLILVIGVIIRIPFMLDGLSFRYEFDENNTVVIVTKMLSQKTLDPGWYGHPSQTVFYFLAAIMVAIYGVGSILGTFSSPEDFSNWFHNDPSLLYLFCRMGMLFLAMASIYVWAKVARLVSNNNFITLATAFILAISPLYAQHSPLLRSSDIVMALFIGLSALYTLHAYVQLKEHSNTKAATNYFALAGFFLGFAISTKYYAVVWCTGIITAVLLANAKFIKTSIISGLACVAGTFISGPYLFLNYAGVMKNVEEEGRTTHISATAPNSLEDFVWFNTMLAQDALGYLLFFLTLFGTCILLSKKHYKSLTVIVPAFVFLCFISYLNLRWDRWALALVPVYCMLSAIALQQIHLWLKDNEKSKYWLYGIILICVAQPVYKLSTLYHDLMRPDSRTQAALWIEKQIPQNSTMFIEMHGPQVEQSKYQLSEINNGRLDFITQDNNSYRLKLSRSKLYDLDNIKSFEDKGVEYVVISNFYQRLIDSPFTDEYAEGKEKYNFLFNNYKEVYKSSIEDRGPAIHIFKLSKN